MSREIHKLSAGKVAKSGKGKLCDGGGLWLVKDGKTGGRWSFRYQFEGKSHELGLGSIHTISLTEAREKAKQLRKLQDKKIDPLKDRRDKAARARIEEASATTFKDFAKDHIDRNRAKWSNIKHEKQWTQSLAAYVFPLIGDLPIAAIDTEAVKRVLQQHVDGVPFWSARPETASRVRNRIEKILDAAKVSGKREGENPAKWKGHLEHLFASRNETEKGEKRHLAAMPFAEVPAFMEALRRQEGVAARLLEFAILAAARPGEARALPWSEINLPDRIWTCPASRMKNRKEHEVPLPARAVEILEALKADSTGKYVFPGRGGHLVSDKAMRRLMAAMGQGDYTVHGFRSSFKDWASEATEYPREVSEMALAHKVGSAVEQAYMRTKLFNRRRAIMDDWSTFCGGPTGTVLKFP